MSGNDNQGTLSRVFQNFLPKGKRTKKRGYNPAAITVRNPVLLQDFLKHAVSNVEMAFSARNEKYNLSSFFCLPGAVFIHKGIKRRRTANNYRGTLLPVMESIVYARHFSTDCRTDRYKLTRIDDTRSEAGRSPIRETRMYDIVQHTMPIASISPTPPADVQLQKLSHFTSRTAPHRITSSFLPRSQRRSNGRWNSIEPPNRREGCCRLARHLFAKWGDLGVSSGSGNYRECRRIT